MNHDKLKYKSGLNWIFALLLFMITMKIAGFFTISESIAITRVFKVVVRVGITGLSLLLYLRLQSKGMLSLSRLQYPAPVFAYMLYLFMGAVSMLWSTDKIYSGLQLFMDTELFFFSFLLIRIFQMLNFYHKESGIRYSRVLMYSVFLVQTAMIIGKIVAPDTFFRLTHGGEVARLGGFLMNPNELGMLSVVGVAMLFFEMRITRFKWNYIPVFLMIVYALVLTGSRSSMIGFFLVSAYFVLKTGSVLLKTGFVVTVVLLAPIVFNAIFLKMGDLDEVLSMTGRIPFWKALLTEALPQEPLKGFGFMRIYYTDYFEGVHTYAAKMTHNTFIQVLLNLGLIGFTIVLFQMYYTLRLALKSDLNLKILFVATFIPLLINSFTEFGIFGETNFAIFFYQALIFMLSMKFEKRITRFQRIQIRKAGYLELFKITK